MNFSFHWLLFFTLFASQAQAITICGIDLKSEYWNRFSTTSRNSDFEKNLLSNMPHLKYYYTSDSLKTFVMLGEFKLDSSQAKYAGIDSLDSTIPSLLEGIDKATTGNGEFEKREGRVMNDHSSRIEIQLKYKSLPGGEIFYENRALIFVSPSCRMDAIIFSASGDDNEVLEEKGAFLAHLHNEASGKLWKMPDKATTKPGINFTQALIWGLLGSLFGAGFSYYFGKKRKRKSTSPNG